MGQTNTRDIEAAAIVLKTARICGVSPRYVRMVICGDRTNETVLKTYMELLEHGDEKENELKLAVMAAVPIETPARKTQNQKV